MTRKTKIPELLVILPALNEELAIKPTIEKIKHTCPEADIIVIDNGSTDSTVTTAESLGIKVLHEPQKGKGFAIAGLVLGIIEVLLIFLIVGILLAAAA